MAEWYVDLQKALGIKPTPANNRFFQNWQRWEGGHTNNSARYNWLNTTHGPGTSINGVGVKAFKDYQTGIRSMAETLMNGRYDDIVSGLKAGNPYQYDVSSGLQVWVSGRPDGNPGYARKVLGGTSGGGAPKAALPQGGRGPTGNPGLAPPPLPGLGLPKEFVKDVWGDLAPLFNAAFPSKLKASPGRARNPEAPSGPSGPESPLKRTGKGFLFPTTPHGTHVTDGLGWGTKTAQDIMAAPGTAVQAPMGGRVVYWHPTGAQGGGSMLIRLDNGRQYWLGHIANGIAPGTRFKRGQTLALVSSDHPAPHLHIDVR